MYPYFTAVKNLKFNQLTFQFVVQFIALQVFSFLVCASTGSNANAAEFNLQTGDLIFHMSKSSQSDAIGEATHSPYTHMGVIVQENGRWWVYEAIQPVTRTALGAWIRRGKNGHFVVKRLKQQVLDMSSPKNQMALVDEMRKYFGLNYDLFFQWSDDRIYCSELAFKAYAAAHRIQIGQVQTLSEMDLSSEKVKLLLAEREKLMGKEANMNEAIITPVSMMNSLLLVEIARYTLGEI
jgi:hypothetical protein